MFTSFFSIPFGTSIFSPCQRLWGSWQGAGFPQCIEGNSKHPNHWDVPAWLLPSHGKRIDSTHLENVGICKQRHPSAVGSAAQVSSGCSRCMSSGFFHFGFQLSQLSPWSDHLWRRNALTHPGGGIPGPCDRRPNTALLDRCGLRPSPPGAEKLVGDFGAGCAEKGETQKKLGNSGTSLYIVLGSPRIWTFEMI